MDPTGNPTSTIVLNEHSNKVTSSGKNEKSLEKYQKCCSVGKVLVQQIENPGSIYNNALTNSVGAKALIYNPILRGQGRRAKIQDNPQLRSKFKAILGKTFSEQEQQKKYIFII